MPQGLLVAGLVLSAAGTGASLIASKKQSEANQDIIRAQERQNAIRQQQMEADARRRRLEVIRNQQRARAAALAAATNQGAIGGSGLQGGYGQIAGQSTSNIEGINQNLGFGEQIFALDNSISGYRMDASHASTLGYFGAGLSSLGGSLASSAATAGRVFDTGAGVSGGVNYVQNPQIYGNNAFGNYGIY